MAARSLLLRLEVRRLLDSKSVKAILLLPLVLVLVAALLRSRILPYMEAARAFGLHVDRVWLVPLGDLSALGSASVSAEAQEAASAASGLSLASVASYAWIVAILFATASMAADVSSGRLAFLATKPVTRRGIVLSKALAVFSALLILYLVSAASSYAAGWLLAGRQSFPWLIPVYAVAEAAASMPLALLTMIYSLKLKRSGSTLAAALLTYFALAMLPLIVSITSLAHGGLEPTKAFALLSVAEPVHSMSLGRLVLRTAVEGLAAPYTLPGLGRVSGLSLGEVLAAAAAADAAASAAALYGLARYLSRYDVPE